MLKQAEHLHLCALKLAIASFGEMNVQTSKHYGNLGRLYQSTEEFGKAEEMHKKAIEIKEKLLGIDDYEVALSIGHLASLYNYDLNQFEKAETLYLRSIDIGIKLFGPGYSGLEYDYRGLVRVYQETDNWDNFLKYTNKLRDWKMLREAKEDEMSQENGLVSNSTLQPIGNVVQMVVSSDKDEERKSILEDVDNIIAAHTLRLNNDLRKDL